MGYLAERTRGRMLVLFTNAEDLRNVAVQLEDFLAERRIPLWYQRMEGTTKEELGELFRTHVDSVLFGLDTFWFGTDFPGHTLEYLVVVRLPYGVPDRYHHAQCAALGSAEQRRQIYMPRALAKLRQGFVASCAASPTAAACSSSTAGSSIRAIAPSCASYRSRAPSRTPAERGARLVTGDGDRCLDAALGHMEMKADVRRRGLERPFTGWTPSSPERSTRPERVVETRR